MSLYIQSDIFLLIHLPITIFLYFILGKKLKHNIDWLLIISTYIGALIQIDNIFSSIILTVIIIINYKFKKKKNTLITFNILIWLICSNLEFLLDIITAGDKYSYPNLNFIYFNNWILMFFFLTQIQSIIHSKLTKKNISKFILCSLLPLICLPLSNLTKNTCSLTPILKKEKIIGVHYFCLALILKLFFITTFQEWAQIGIHSGFSLNIVQAWALLLFNTSSIVFNIIYVLLIIGGCSVIFSNYNETSLKLDKELFDKFISPYHQLFKNIKSVIVKVSIIGFGIILFLALNWYQLFGILPLLITYWIIASHESWLLGKIKYFIISLLSLLIVVNTFIELKEMLIGLINIPSLFVYYNEYFILQGFGAEPFTSFILITITIIILKKRNSIFTLIRSQIKYSYILLILYPILSLIQLS